MLNEKSRNIIKQKNRRDNKLGTDTLNNEDKKTNSIDTEYRIIDLTVKTKNTVSKSTIIVSERKCEQTSL